MELLRRWLESESIQIKSERIQPDGSRRIVIVQADGSLMELVLSREILQGTREAAKAFILGLLNESARPPKLRPKY
jgi:hypothetical protein